ncbi:MAG TPA: hypothetical protein VGK58_20145 [Lacipirellulaceae bacterium]
MKKLLFAVAVLGIFCGRVSADLVFATFNTDETPFTSDPNDSGTSVDDNPNSTAVRVVNGGADGFGREGIGFQKLVLNYEENNALVNGIRIRHLSGGGTPSSNMSFTTSAGIDGWIGYWVRTTVAGLTTSINLDGPGNTGAEMDGSTPIDLMADGQWHLYEWNLDSAASWTTVPGIGGTAGLADGTHTVDSIYFRDANGLPSPSGTYYLDFVALNSTGSVALITPAAVPEAGAIAAMGLVGLISAGAVWFKKRRAGQVAA